MGARRYGSTGPDTDEDLQQIAALPRRVIVKFFDQPPQGIDRSQQPAVAGLAVEDAQERVAAAFEGYTVMPTVTSVSGEDLDRLYADAVAEDPTVENLRSFIAVELPADADPDAIIRRAQDIRDVEYAYLEPAVAPPPVTPDDDPRFPNQGYLEAAPKGIDARFAWSLPGGDGAGVGVVDMEQGWALNHEDLVAQNIPLISGSNILFIHHGTAVLGVICGADNTLGGIGIVPAATVRVVSQHQPGGNRIDSAIASATVSMSAGDVLLLEAQSPINGFYHPVEIDPKVRSAIRQAVRKGIVVVEAAGNGRSNPAMPWLGLDLDTVQNPLGKRVLNRNHADFRDSRAIMVGAGSSATPRRRMGFSNYGSRIDCHAWGENVDTADFTQANPTTAYRPDPANNRPAFGGTSSASAIIASVVAAMQGLMKANRLPPFFPEEARRIFRESYNTPSSNPATDRIGAMPDLRAIYQRAVVPLIRPVGDFPAPPADRAYAGPSRPPPLAFIDPGHGGQADRGRSTAQGASGGRQTREKDVNLRLGRSIRRHLGPGAALTRDGDYNLSLGERAQLARQSGAPVFVSVHANATPSGRRGAEVWVYGNGQVGPSSESRALAQAVCEELARLGHGASVRTGDLAVLHPAHHRQGIAACLVEADDLAHPDGEARLRDPAQVDALGAAVARGVKRYLGAARRSA